MDVINETRQQLVDAQERLQSFLMLDLPSNNLLSSALVNLDFADQWLEIVAEKEKVEDAVEYAGIIEPYQYNEEEQGPEDVMSDMILFLQAIVHFFDGHRWGQLRDNNPEVIYAIQNIYEASFLLSFELSAWGEEEE